MILPKLDNSSLWDKTYTLLKDRIIHRDFKPNQKLSIPELAEQLGVSRTPIRDALNRLEMDGLVKTVAKVGTFVTAIMQEDVLDIMDTRLMLELWVIDKLQTLPQAELAQKLDKLVRILDQSSEAVEQLPLETYLKSDYNLQFHLEFIKLGSNKRNGEIYINLMNYHYLAVKHSLITKQMVLDGIGEHQAIIHALQEGNFAAAKASIRLHLQESTTSLLKRLDANGGEI